MSATVADILRGAGFVPVVPEVSRMAGTAQRKLASRVPDIPVVPAETYKVRTGVAPVAEQTHSRETPEAIRARLVKMAQADRLNPALVNCIPPAELHQWAGFPSKVLTAGLRTFADNAEREAGQAPIADRAVALCRSCGPVWVHAAIASGSPVEGGWAYLLGCLWCFVRKRGIKIPRPHVACADCNHRVPDKINPAGGMGRCALATDDKERMYHPHQKHRCGDWQPSEPSQGAVP